MAAKGERRSALEISQLNRNVPTKVKLFIYILVYSRFPQYKMFLTAGLLALFITLAIRLGGWFRWWCTKRIYTGIAPHKLFKTQGLQLDVISSDILKRGSFRFQFLLFQHKCLLTALLKGERWEAIWIHDHVYACVLKVRIFLCFTSIQLHYFSWFQQYFYNWHRRPTTLCGSNGGESR